MQKIILDLYKKAYRIREVEKEISRRYSEEKMRCPVHLSIGQEAVSAAFSLVVKKKDFTVSTHRGHAHYLAKGGSLKKKNDCRNIWQRNRLLKRKRWIYAFD